MSNFHMRPAATEQATHALGQNGQGLGDNWQSAKAAIAGSEGGIGPDRLGVAFRAVYTADSTAARTAADPVPTLLVGDATAGTKSVHLYRETETVNEGEFGGATPQRL